MPEPVKEERYDVFCHFEIKTTDGRSFSDYPVKFSDMSLASVLVIEKTLMKGMTELLALSEAKAAQPVKKP